MTIIRKSLRLLLLSGCVALPLAGQALAQGLSVGGENGVSVDVNTNDGLGVDASVGGANGVNADVGIGGSNGVADVNASVGGNNGVNANVGVGASDGLDAGVTASIGGANGVNAGVNLGVGGTRGTGLGVDLGVGGGGAGGGAGGAGGGLTGPQAQAFNNMSDSERRRMLTRCADILSGDGDRALIQLCRMLRLSASR